MMVVDNVCGTEWKRQQVYTSVNTLAPHSMDEKVPIVEIKPFVREKSEWCRAKSLPEFYDQCDGSNNQKSPDGKETRTNSDSLSPRSPTANVSTGSFPVTYRSMFPEKMETRQNTFSFPNKTAPVRELTLMDGRTSAWGDMTTPAPTPRPGVSFMATTREREWFTNEDLRNGIPNICNMQFGTSVSKPEEHYGPKPYLKVNGFNFGPGKYFQLNARNYSLYKAYTEQIEKKEREKDYIYRRMMTDTPRRSSDEIYKLDTNRTTSSPFFNVKNAQRRRNTGPRSSRMGTANRPSQCSSSQGYRVGTVRNSLELLSEIGKPLKIEKQISDDYNSTLSQIRKNNYTCFTSPAPPPSLASYSHFRLSSALPTQGEIMLAEARYANSLSNRRNVARPITQTSNYTHKTGRTPNRPHSPRASVLTMSHYKSENPDNDSGIQSPMEETHGQSQQKNELLHHELNSKLNLLETEQSNLVKRRTGSAPAGIEQNVPLNINTAEEDSKSQTSQTRLKKSSPFRGSSPVKETTFLRVETPSLIIQTPVIPEETNSDNDS